MRIFLLGFMGTGKSHWGQRWAAANDMLFFDLDKEIEKTEGQTVSAIFEKKGEDYFREVEAAVLRTTGLKDNCIIACGGGTPCFFDNMQWMNGNGYTLFLAAQPQFILENVEKEKGMRPLIKNMNAAELLFFIEQKQKERLPFYSQAKGTVEAKNITEQSFETIIQSLIS